MISLVEVKKFIPVQLVLWAYQHILKHEFQCYESV